MKKARIVFITFVATVIVICLFTCYEYFLHSMNGKFINQALFDIIKTTHQLNEDLTIDEITVDGENAHMDSYGQWWLATVGKKHLVQNEPYYPEIQFSTLQENRYVAVLSDGITLDSVENDEALYVIVFSTRFYNIYRLRFTTLPIMELSYDDTADLENDTPADFNNITGFVRLRGHMTRSYPKKSFTITLSEKYSLLGMRKDDDWILYAGYNDQERVRNVFSANLWFNTCAGNNAFQVRNGCEYRYVELFINGFYSGLYALGYKPDQKQFDIHDGEYLYSKFDSGDDQYELHGYRTESREDDAWSALEGLYLYDKSSSIDLWLFTNLCANVDNIMKNYYLSLKKDEQGLLRAVYAPYDCDLSWGNSWNYSAKNQTEAYIIPSDYPVCIEAGYVFECYKAGDKSVVEELKERYTLLRENLWSDETLTSLISDYEDSIYNSGAYLRDCSIWTDSNSQDPELKLSLFKDYLLKRTSWMDDYMSSLEQIQY